MATPTASSTYHVSRQVKVTRKRMDLSAVCATLLTTTQHISQRILVIIGGADYQPALRKLMACSRSAKDLWV
jgi:hypothetical protein